MISKTFIRITLLVTWLLGALAVHATPVARVAVSVGEAQKFNAAGRQESLKVGASLMAGDRIRTGSDSVAILVFTDQGRISLRADSELIIHHYQIDPAGIKTRIELELVKGTVRQISGNASRTQPERYKLNTPVAVIGVRGTDFLAKTTGDAVEAFVHEGKIILTPAQGACAQSECAPVAMASSDTQLKYVRLSTDGRVEQREFRQGELERIFGIDMARVNTRTQTTANAGTNATPAGHATSRMDNNEAQLPEGTRLVTSTIFAAYTEAETRAHSKSDKSNLDAVKVPATDPADLNLASKAPATQTPVELPKQLAWGRFSAAQSLQQTLLVAYNEAHQGRHVTVGELGEYALWRANPVGRMSANLKGQADFRLAGADAMLVQTSGISAAQVTAATLGVDFDRSRFNATVGLQHATAGNTNISVGGKINEEGVFVGTKGNERVAGALTRDGTEAGYLFSKDVAAGTFRGITLWKR
jgi:hypothetical protein